jgi:protein involved in polysaccharide export with SLBB domain
MIYVTKKIVILIFSFVFIISISSFAQINNSNPNTNTSNTRDNTSNLNQSVSNPIRINTDISDILTGMRSPVVGVSAPIEDAINPNFYIIGPNDIFLLGLYGYVNQQVQLTVNPEGSVVIPTVGEFQVSGMKLSDAKKDIIKAVKKRYYSSDVSFTLLSPRTFLVNLTGLVQGTFQATPLTRASELMRYLVFDTLNISKTLYEKTNRQEFEKPFFRTQISMRNLILRRKNGVEQKVDIYKYYNTKDDKYNPYLIEGDQLKVPNILIEKNYVSISGAVQLGGLYEFSEGDDLETLIGLGRGFDVNAEPDSIILYRPHADKIGVDIVDLSYDKDKAYKIKIFDRIFVKFKSNYQQMATVLVLGEVQRPGYYPVSYKSTKIKEVLEMAGGLKNTACLPLSILFRYWDGEYTTKDSMENYFNQRANDLLITPNDRANFQVDLRARRNRVVLDYEKLINKNDESQNLILEDKDIIYINDNKNIVYVYGQVNNEGYVPFVLGKDYEYYIEQSGGYALGAEKGDTRIIKFSSRGWYKPGTIEVTSGDFIYVPKADKKTFAENFSLIATGISLLISIITTYLLYRSYTK